MKVVLFYSLLLTFKLEDMAMNSQLIDSLRLRLGNNGLPYEIPMHPKLVHLTLGLIYYCHRV